MPLTARLFRQGSEAADRFVVEQQIGSGASGDVFLAYDSRLQRKVAVKVLRLVNAHDPAFVERFEREGRLCAQIRHPNVVTVHDLGTTDDGRPYLILEYIDGPTLADAAPPGTRLDPRQVARYGADVAGALAAAHAVGLVHRDVKPDNIFLDREGRAHLGDFGFAVDPKARSITRLGRVIGSPPYVAPEQAQGRAVPASDYYSLAVVLYELLAGRLPFEDDSEAKLLAAHASRAPPPLSALAPGCPERLRLTIERCLGKDPTLRFPGAAALEAALRAVTVDPAAPPRPPPGPLSGLLQTMPLQGNSTAPRPPSPPVTRSNPLASTEKMPDGLVASVVARTNPLASTEKMPDGLVASVVARTASLARTERMADGLVASVMAARRRRRVALRVGALLMFGGVVAVVALLLTRR